MRQLVRYKNRHIYDYENCRYVKLPDILEIVRSNEDFKVIEDGTSRDITREVLLGIIHQEIISKYVFPKNVLFKVLKETPIGESPFMRLFNFNNLTEIEIRKSQLHKENEPEKIREIAPTVAPILMSSIGSFELPFGNQTATI